MWGQQPGGYGGGMQGNYGGGMQGNYGGGGMGGGYGGNMGGGFGGGMGMGVNIMPGQPYKILSGYDQQFCLDSSQGFLDRGSLILYRFHGGHNQIWKFQPDQNCPGAYYILNHKDGALEPPDNWNEPGDQCWLDDRIYDDTQSWKIQPGYGNAQGRGFHITMSDGPGFCLDVEGEKFEDETRIITWPCNGQPNQTWIIQPHY